MNVCISNCPSDVSLIFPWVFRLLARSLWGLHASSIHAGTDSNIIIALLLFQLLCLLTAASQHLYHCQPVSPTVFPTLYHLHNLLAFFFSHTLIPNKPAHCDSYLLFEPVRLFLILLAFISCLNYLGNYFGLKGH